MNQQIPNRIRQIVIRSRQVQPFFQLQSDIPFHYDERDTVIKVLFFSVDPVMKVWLSGAKTNFRVAKVGQVFNCFGLGLVVKSPSQQSLDFLFQEGSYIFGNTGTTQYLNVNSQKKRQLFEVPKDLVLKFGLANFLYLINNGLAAFSGVDFIKQKANFADTVIVSTAAGATGLLVCHLLIKAGINVIALTSQKKIEHFRKFYPKIQKVVNYTDFSQLKKMLEQQKFVGYFDNVGQRQLQLVIQYIQDQGRISLCGGSSGYNNYKQVGIRQSGLIYSKRLSLKGINFSSLIPEAFQIFQQFSDCQFATNLIQMQDFNYFFQQILKSGGTTIGKVIVKLDQQPKKGNL